MTIVGVTHMAGERLILSLSKDAGALGETVSTRPGGNVRCRFFLFHTNLEASALRVWVKIFLFPTVARD
ncbi:MAG: hypothetical protein B7Y90_08640 [Alphaproteobacteria bacterium 32-64-14]|nr:MAG: hypothetical protein B7Y90_08640 [Alphaproteobacteria bacterium 32-64-14]